MTFSTESNSQILLGSELATHVQGTTSTPLAEVDVQNRPGWYYDSRSQTNSIAQTNNFVWTIFNGTDQNYTLGDVQNLTFTATHDNLPVNKCYIAISSTAGSKIAYKNDNVDLIPGEKCLFYTNNVPQNPDQLRLVQLNLVIISGTGEPTEQLSTITLEGTNVGFSDNSLQVCVENIGYLLSSNTVHIISSLIADKSTSIIVDSVKIKATNGDSITATTGSINSNITNTSLDTHCYASSDGTTWHQLASDANGQLNVHSKLQDGAGTDITSTLNGAKQSLDVNVANTVTVNTISGFALETGGNLASIKTNTDKIKSDTTNTDAIQVQVKNSSIPVTGTITANISANQRVLANVYDWQNNGITSTNHTLNKYGLDTTSALATTDMNTRYLLTSTLNGAKQSLDVNVANTVSIDTSSPIPVTGDITIANDSTTNFNSATGLNVYQILPKIKQYTIGGFDEQNSVYRLFGLATPGGINTTTTDFGLANPRVHYGGISSGIDRDAYIDYVDPDGDLVENSGPYTFNSPTYAELPRMIAPIKFRLTSNLSPGQAVYISTTENSSVTSVAGLDQNQYCIGTFTVPNGYIGYISHLNSTVGATTNIQIVKWDVYGVRSVVYRFNNTGIASHTAGYEGGLGGIFYAGETVAFSNQTAVASKSCFANMILKSIL